MIIRIGRGEAETNTDNQSPILLVMRSVGDLIRDYMGRWLSVYGSNTDNHSPI